MAYSAIMGNNFPRFQKSFPVSFGDAKTSEEKIRGISLVTAQGLKENS